MCDPLDAAELGCCSVPYRGAEMKPLEEDYAAQQQLGGEVVMVAHNVQKKGYCYCLAAPHHHVLLDSCLDRGDV